MKIAVLMGGTSPERDVSLVSGEAVVKGLRQAGHAVVSIDTARGYQALRGDEIKHLPGIKTQPPSIEELRQYAGDLSIEAVKSTDLKDVDIVFLILHGGAGEDGTIQALLDLVGIPYTGSGVLASALAMNKLMAKMIFRANGIPTPDYLVLESLHASDLSALDASVKSNFGYPIVIKPVSQGSSVGLSLVKSSNELQRAIEIGFQYDTKLLVESFIPGREITVAILGDLILPLAECVPESGFYDYEHKYTHGKTKYYCPADLPAAIAQKIGELGLKAFKVLNCAGFARIDFRLAKDNEAYCLEVNTLPGMTEHSLVPKAARAAGIEFPELVEKICRIAIDDYSKRTSMRR